MEFVAALLLLYSLHCLVHLPNGAVLFAGRARHFVHTAGPGWRLAHPIPSFSSLIGERPPWIERQGTLYGRGVASRMFAGDFSKPLPAFDAEAPTEVSVHGDLVRIGGAAFARTTSEAGAKRIGSLLESVAGMGRDAVNAGFADLLADELSLAKLSDARTHLAAATRWLRAMLDVYAFTLCIALPIAIAWIGDEPALWRGLPVVVVLHLACLVTFGLTDRRLRPEATGDRVQTLFEIAFYPPSLLRSFHRLESEVLGRFHPATIASAVLDTDAGKRFLRAEIVRAQRAASAPTATAFPSLELRALERLVTATGNSVAALLVAPDRQDPLADAYCPACHTEYRRTTGACTDCGFTLLRYEAKRMGSADGDSGPAFGRGDR